MKKETNLKPECLKRPPAPPEPPPIRYVNEDKKPSKMQSKDQIFKDEIEPVVMFSYVDIKSAGCEGWINLFFGQHCIAMISNPVLAKEIKKRIPNKLSLTETEWGDFCDKCGVSNPKDYVLPHTCFNT